MSLTGGLNGPTSLPGDFLMKLLIIIQTVTVVSYRVAALATRKMRVKPDFRGHTSII